MPTDPKQPEAPPRQAAEQERPQTPRPSRDVNEEPLPGEEELARKHERIVERPTD